MSSAAALLLYSLSHAQITWYLSVASLAVATLEAIACFPEEVTYIWPANWDHVKVLYLLARYFLYVPFALMTLINTSQSLPSVLTCKVWIVAGSVTTFAVSTIAGTLLALRVYALAQRSRIVGIFLATLGIALHTTAYVLDIRAMSDPTMHVASPIPLIIPCLTLRSGKAGNGVVLAYCMILVTEIVVLGMTIWLCLSKYRASESSLVSSLYKDGLWYFVVLSLSSAANIVCYARAPSGLNYLFVSPQTTLHGVISTRMVLHLRKTARLQAHAGRGTGGRMTHEMELSTMRFDVGIGPQPHSVDTDDSNDTYATVDHDKKSLNLSTCLRVADPIMTVSAPPATIVGR